MTVPTDTVSRRLQSLAWSDIKQHAPWLPSSRTLVSGFLCLILLQILYSRGRKSDLRVYNPKKWWELTTMRAKREFDANAPAWIEAWFSKNDQPLRFIVDSGYCTILPSSMADEFRKMKELCMYKFLGTVSLSLSSFHLPAILVSGLLMIILTVRTSTLIFPDSTASKKSPETHISSPRWS